MLRGAILALCLAGVAGLKVQCHAAQVVHLEIQGLGTTGPYRLGYPHIIVNSQHITIGGRLLYPDVDYRFNYDDGLVFLTKPLATDDTLKIDFAVLPIELKPSYFQLRPSEIAGIDTVASSPPTAKKWNESQLNIAGSKGFFINIGNAGEPSLSQSLDLDISGQLAEEIYLTGSISDRNFTSAPRGATRSLDELDRILLSLEAENFRGAFGDLELEGINNSLLDYRRRLTGMNVSGQAGPYQGASALAFSPGKQAELFFYGIDGKQGPYLFSNTEALSTISTSYVFLPGTEEVYLDGSKLKRGNEYDYDINYDEGYIEFTPKNVISSRSRITIKIQYAPEGYQRNFYNAHAARDRNFSLGFQYIGEHDDKSRPRGFDIGQVEREALSRAGALPDSAYSPGARFVGPGQGQYVQLTDSLGAAYYEYVGADSGDYEVAFTRVGDGRGDYQYIGTGKYLYVGQAKGSYQPLIYYPLPETDDYGSLILNREGDLYLRGELALSRADKNMLSEKDKVAVGAGLTGSTGLRRQSLTFLGRQWDADVLNLDIRSLDDEFSVPGIINPPEFFRKYNIPQNRAVAGEQIAEISSGTTTARGDLIKLEAGNYDDDDFRARRGFGQFNIIQANRVAFFGSGEISNSKNKITDRRGDWNKYDAGFKFIEGRWQPGFTYRHELNSGLISSTEAFKADEYETSLLAFPLKTISTTSKILFRRQDYFVTATSANSGWKQEFDQYQVEQGFLYGSADANFNGELNFSRLYQKRYYPDQDLLTRNMGNLKLNYNARDYAITFYESVNGTGQVLRAREYIFVGDGKGDYRKDGEDYVPEPGGDYVEIIRPLGEGGIDLSNVYEITGGIRGRLDGAALEDNGLISKLSYDNDLAHKTDLLSGTALKIKFLFPSATFNHDEMSLKTYDYRQRLTLRLNTRGDYIRHTLKSSESRGTDFQFESLDSRAVSNLGEFKLRSGHIVSYSASGEIASDRRSLYSGSVDLDRIRAGLTPIINPSPAIRVEAPLEYAIEEEHVRGLQIKSYLAQLHAVLNLRSLGRLEIEQEYTRVDAGGQNIFLPYVIASGKKPGNNHRTLLSARFKLNSFSYLELRFNYKRLGDGYTNDNLRLEARAQF